MHQNWVIDFFGGSLEKRVCGLGLGELWKQEIWAKAHETRESL